MEGIGTTKECNKNAGTDKKNKTEDWGMQWVQLYVWKTGRINIFLKREDKRKIKS